MKIIAIERECGQMRGELGRLAKVEEVEDPVQVQSTVISDSAIVREHTPLFVPDFANGWRLVFAPAYTIGRLGKSIPAKFAGRYISGFRLTARLLPPVAYGKFGGISATFDGAISFGPESSRLPQGEICIKVSHASLPMGEMICTVNAADFEIEDTIAFVSRYVMLRTGDVIVPCNLLLEVKPEIDTRVQVELNGEMVLSLKIK